MMKMETGVFIALIIYTYNPTAATAQLDEVLQHLDHCIQSRAQGHTSEISRTNNRIPDLFKKLQKDNIDPTSRLHFLKVNKFVRPQSTRKLEDEHKTRIETNYRNKMANSINQDTNMSATSLLRDLMSRRLKRQISLIIRRAGESDIRRDMINRAIDDKEKKPKKDIILEAVSHMIEDEKIKKKFNIVNPPNSKFNKIQQNLWNRLRVKAMEELLLRPVNLPLRRGDSKLYNDFKMDFREATTVRTYEEEGIFTKIKNKVLKQYYIDQLL